jgi:hypothetical protein
VLDPRATDAVDVDISVPVSEASPVFRHLPAAVAWENADVEQVRQHGQVRLRWAPDRTPLDLFFPQHRFHDAVAAAVKGVPFAGITLPIISATHLTVFKCLFNRSRDWPDIEAMLVAGSVDVAEATAWVGELLGEDALQLARLRGLIDEVGTGSIPAAGTEMTASQVDWDAARACGHWMPRSMRLCTRPAGHRGAHS